jgi:hypothetical protein
LPATSAVALTSRRCVERPLSITPLPENPPADGARRPRGRAVPEPPAHRGSQTQVVLNVRSPALRRLPGRPRCGRTSATPALPAAGLQRACATAAAAPGQDRIVAERRPPRRPVSTRLPPICIKEVRRKPARSAFARNTGSRSASAAEAGPGLMASGPNPALRRRTRYRAVPTSSSGSGRYAR